MRHGVVLYWTEAPFPSIRRARLDGTGNRRILHNKQNSKRPRLSPDGRWIAFDGAPPGKPAFSDFDIQIVRPGGGDRRTLTNSSAWDVDADWSPDGRWLSLSRATPHSGDLSRSSSIWLVRRDGTHAHRLVEGYGARWAPDGRRLVYQPRAGQGRRLAIIDADASNQHVILQSGHFVSPAAWSPDGRHILLTEQTSGGAGGEVAVAAADGSDLRRLRRGFAAAYSPDGAAILYTTAALEGELRVMNSDGSRVRRLGGLHGSEPSWGVATR